MRGKRIDKGLILKASRKQDHMFGTFFAVLVLIALASIGSNLVMRIRVIKKLPPESGTSWWMRSSDEVGRTYQELFPKSYLPPFIQYVFWFLLALCAATAILIALRKSI
jgi:hypothetical protein